MSDDRTSSNFKDLPALGELRAHLAGYVAATERSDRHVMRRRRFGVRRMLALAAALLVGGSAGAAVLSSRESSPLSGTLPAPILDLHTSGDVQYSVRLFPFLSVGWTGWCSSVTFSSQGRTVETSYGCAPVERSDAVVLEADEEGGQGGDYLTAILTDRVAKVRYADGITVRPIADPRLPSWARAAIRVITATEAASFEAHRRGRRVASELLGEEWLTADGRRLIERPTFRSEAIEHLPLTTLDPRHPADLPCTIHAGPLKGLVPISQTVTAPVPWPRQSSGGLLACANAVYRLDGTNLAAAVLVNAADPGHPAEALPGVRPDPADVGILLGGAVGTIGYPEGSAAGGAITKAFESFGTHQWDLTEEHNARTHDVSAKRAGHGWLVVEGGTSSQRAELLRSLTTEA